VETGGQLMEGRVERGKQSQAAAGVMPGISEGRGEPASVLAS